MKSVEYRSAVAFGLALIFLGTNITGQSLVNGVGKGSAVALFSSDRAVLEAGEPRKDLPCAVIPDKAVLGFDLRFHAGYEVTVPLRELSGGENLLTILFRVIPDDQKEEPRYFIQRIRVPAIEEEQRGDAYLQGVFDVGEGKYHVDWLIRDRSERVCSSYWDFEVALPPKDKQVSITVPPNSVQPFEFEQFRAEPPVARNGEAPLNVKVLVNFAPQNARSSALQPRDLSALVSILRTISRDPRIGKFSVTAFNVQEQKVVFRQNDSDRIDFPGLGKALGELKLGTIDLGRLSKKNSETEFLGNLIREEMKLGDTGPDAVVFAGPKVMLEENVSSDFLKEMGDVPYPVFYMNYNLWPQQVPWRDSISHAVKHFRGVEYTISRPRDLWYAVSEMVSRAAKSRLPRRAQLQATQ